MYVSLVSQLEPKKQSVAGEYNKQHSLDPWYSQLLASTFIAIAILSFFEAEAIKVELGVEVEIFCCLLEGAVLRERFFVAHSRHL